MKMIYRPDGDYSLHECSPYNPVDKCQACEDEKHDPIRSTEIDALEHIVGWFRDKVQHHELGPGSNSIALHKDLNRLLWKLRNK
jgi:hypothetical protein